MNSLGGDVIIRFHHLDHFPLPQRWGQTQNHRCTIRPYWDQVMTIVLKISTMNSLEGDMITRFQNHAHFPLRWGLGRTKIAGAQLNNIGNKFRP